MYNIYRFLLSISYKKNVSLFRFEFLIYRHRVLCCRMSSSLLKRSLYMFSSCCGGKNYIFYKDCMLSWGFWELLFDFSFLFCMTDIRKAWQRRSFPFLGLLRSVRVWALAPLMVSEFRLIELNLLAFGRGDYSCLNIVINFNKLNLTGINFSSCQRENEPS